MNSVIVIAEIGENHIGDMQRAKKMIFEAAKAGADIVKFQSYLASEVKEDDPEKEWFSQVEISDKAHFELKEYAENYQTEFLSAPFSLNRAQFLCEMLGLNKIKIASSEMLNFPLLDYVNEHTDSVFLSTGMATLEEIKLSISHLNKVNICIMHCITQYPVQLEDVNLNVITTLRDTFPEHSIGYSDHTTDILAPIIAVALGAKVIEKHFTLDKTLPGTDHVLSATPDELSEMVNMIRETEVLLGNSIKKPLLQEEEIKRFVRSRFPK